MHASSGLALHVLWAETVEPRYLRFRQRARSGKTHATTGVVNRSSRLSVLCRSLEVKPDNGVGGTTMYGLPNAPVHERAESRCFHVQSKHLLSISLYANPVFQLNTNTLGAEKTTHLHRNTTSEANDAKVFTTTEHRVFFRPDNIGKRTISTRKEVGASCSVVGNRGHGYLHLLRVPGLL